MNLLRWLMWKLRLVRLCMLVDFDGEHNLRVIRKSLNPNAIGDAQRMQYSCRVSLLPNGKIGGPHFVRRWHYYPMPLDQAAKEVVALEKLMALEEK